MAGLFAPGNSWCLVVVVRSGRRRTTWLARCSSPTTLLSGRGHAETWIDDWVRRVRHRITRLRSTIIVCSGCTWATWSQT